MFGVGVDKLILASNDLLGIIQHIVLILSQNERQIPIFTVLPPIDFLPFRKRILVSQDVSWRRLHAPLTRNKASRGQGMAILRHHLLRREGPRLQEITLTRDYKRTGKSFTVGFFHATGVLKHRVKCNLLWFFDDNQCWGCLGWTLPTDAPEVARRWYESIHRLDLLHFLFLDLRRVLFFFAATHVDRNTSSGRKKHRAGAVRIYVSILTSDDLVRHLRSILGSHGASLTARQARERLITVVEMVRSTDGGRIARDDQVFYLRLQLAFNYGSPSISQ